MGDSILTPLKEIGKNQTGRGNYQKNDSNEKESRDSNVINIIHVNAGTQEKSIFQ